MITVEVELSSDFEKAVELLGQYERISDEHLKKATDASLKLVQGRARTTAPVFRGQLRNSITTETRTVAGEITGRVFSTIQKPYPYPVVMEYGRKPGAKMPPPSAIERWVHLVIKPPARQLKGVAYVVARAIGKRGIKGKFFLTNAVKNSRASIERLFTVAVENISKDMDVN